MQILKINDRVKFGNRNEITGTIVGHCTMLSHGKSVQLLTYAVRLDDEFQGYVQRNGCESSFISTMLVCADGVTKL